MSSQIGRNDLCSCGSGKKHKNCCFKRGVLTNKKSQNKIALGVVAIILVVAGIISYSKFFSTPSTQNPVPLSQPPISSSTSSAASSAPVQSSALPATGTGYTPQPPGQVPAGQVWSTEHGHWHNTLGTGQTATVQPGVITPQPPGPAPEGKIWSAEHGHWHDAPPEVNVIEVSPSKTDPK